ncbi:MAG: hypothetical protein U0531_08745 [Dehalococcoidia bacterium]
MVTSEQERLHRMAARRAEADDFFVGAALAAYRDLEELDDDGLMRALGCDRAGLTRLALCRRPDPASPRFMADVERIAAHAGALPIALVRLLRAVEAHAALSGGARTGFLAAARDREDEAPEPPADAPAPNAGQDRDEP